tara:strand:- start:76 stop:552 length:477 start_codon:yes stop_codon:yes gene_type:complete
MKGSGQQVGHPAGTGALVPGPPVLDNLLTEGGTLYDEYGELPYDGDLSDPSQRCEHGTFTGSWWGPDYMCGMCEDGVSQEDVLESCVAAATRAKDHFLRLVFGDAGTGDCLYRALGGIGWTSSLGEALIATLSDLSQQVERSEAALAKHRDALVGSPD